MPSDNPYRRIERAASDMITARFNLYRDLRDAAMESLFFLIYGPAAVFELVGEPEYESLTEGVNPRELQQVRDALATIGTGGYPEALALIGALVGKNSGPIPLKRLELVERLIEKDEILSQLSRRRSVGSGRNRPSSRSSNPNKGWNHCPIAPPPRDASGRSPCSTKPWRQSN